ncbi:MAG TPA: hypothetical protein PLS15_02960 [Fimbriimonadaceae bacterium]|nr:hypothetical protein [Armatimonadota bacterium]HRD30634.1 hypothetical protein [Fimbriimonadaceae bacterium]HRE93103.1 hypothetical protein [Fimbriimonadaceae bacterium]
MKLNRPTLALALLCAALFAPAQTGVQPMLHPEADAFRAGDSAYLLAPTRPVEAFDFILSVKECMEPCPWLLIEHRARIAQDTATHPQLDTPPATQLSFYNPATRQTRPFPPELNTPPKEWSIMSGGENTVIVGSIREFVPQFWAIRCDTGQTMRLPAKSRAWVVDNERFFVVEPEGHFLYSWSGNPQPLDFQGWSTDIRRTSEPTLFLMRLKGQGGAVNWQTIDFKINQVASISSEAAEKLLFEAHPALAVQSQPSSDAPGLQTAWLRSNGRESPISLHGPGIMQATSESRMPHELDSQARISGDIRDNGWYVPAGILNAATSKGGVVWFLRDHQLFLRDVVPMSLAEYEQYVRRLVQERAMRQAKQMAIGLFIYSADHDDQMPENAGWRDAVTPYLKDKSTLDGIVYLGNGERINEIQDITTGNMGFLDTPYGRANMRWDGSIRWVPKETP